MPKLRILLVSDAASPASGQNSALALSQARIDFDRREATGGSLPELGGYAALVLAVANLQKLDLERLSTFVTDGGGLVCVTCAEARGRRDLFGITPPGGTSADLYSEHQSEGIVFRGKLFPAFAGVDLSDGYVLGHSALDIHPVPKAEVVARTGVGRPLAWRVRRGKGYAIYWNSKLLARKMWRGLIIESLAAVLPVSAIPKANVAVLQADDFPAPLGVKSVRRRWRRAKDPLPTEFYASQWYPDMLRLSRRSGFPMTCFAVFCYTWQGRDLIPPVTGDPLKDCFAAFRAEAGEVGLHGLNHRPLLRSIWSGPEQMVDGLRRAMALWKDQGLGPPPTAYVPPNNEYDADGVQALAEAVPSVTAICGSYELNDPEIGGAREYGQEPFAPHLFAFPRATWGSGCAPEVLPKAVAQVAATGVWSHFLHPDDVTDRPVLGERPYVRRNPNGLRWRGMQRELSWFLSQMRQRYPWLRGCTTSEGAARLRAHLESRWETEIGEGGLRVSGPPGGTIELRLNGDPAPEFGAMRGAKTLHEDEGPGFRLRIIELEDAVAEVDIRQLEMAR